MTKKSVTFRITDKAYRKLLAWLKRQNKNTRDYILRKLARSDVFK